MPHITIAGAGIAGLVVGRCLAERGIYSLLLEKCNSSSRLNYGITLQPWAYHPLLRVLGMSESDFRRRVAIVAPRGGTGILSGRQASLDSETSPSTFRCHRGRLENLLREGLDIKWEHEISKVEVTSPNVLIQFKDREPMSTDILIGTDGVHSQVRKSLAPDVELKVLPYVVFNGKRTMSIQDFEDALAPHMQGTSVMETRVYDVLLQVYVNDSVESKVYIGYTYSRPVRSPEDPLHIPDRPTAGATKIPEAFYLELEALQSLPPVFAEIFDIEKVRQDRILHWLMRTSLGSKKDIHMLTEQGIFLIGDSVHAMPILGGEGANFAMKDAVELASLLVTRGGDILTTVMSSKFDRWKQGVEDSERRIAEMHGQTEPLPNIRCL